MGQITTPWQGSLDGWQASNGGFSNGGGSTEPPETPLGGAMQNPPSTSGFNGASLVQTNGNPQGGVYSQPGNFGNPAAPPPTAPPPAQNQSSFGNPGWKPSYNAPGGYNPLQYASDNTANELAQGLGGTVSRTKTVGPFGDFGQNQIDFGNGNQLNAGLLADRYSKYDAATANAMTDAEKNAGPAVTNPNAGAIFMTGDPTKNSFHGGPGSEPQVTGPQPGAQGQQSGGNQQNPLMQLLMLLGLGGQNRQQNRQPYANSGYYPNLPRGGNQMNPLTPPNGQFSGSQVINSGNAPTNMIFGGTPADSQNYAGQTGPPPPEGYVDPNIAANKANRANDAANPGPAWMTERMNQLSEQAHQADLAAAANSGTNPLLGRAGSFSPQMQQILANGPASPTAFYNMNTGQWTDNGLGLGVNYAQGSGNQNSLSQQNVQRQLLSLLLGF